MRSADVLCSVSGIVSARIEDPLFEGQTKNRLANAGYFAGWQKKLYDALLDYWHGNVDFCDTFFRQVDCNIERRQKAAESAQSNGRRI